MALAVRGDEDRGPQAIVPHSVQEAMSLSAELARSSLIDGSYKSKAADIFHIVLAGAELGIPPIASTRVFYVDQKGLPKMFADGIVAVVLARRDVCEYFRLIESTEKIATFETKRKGDPPTRMSYTYAQAQTAQLLGKQPWKMDLSGMLRHRCKSALAKTVYPDLVAGIRVVEEDDDTESTAYVAPPPPAAAPAPAAPARAPAKGKAKPPAEPAPADPNVIDAEYADVPPPTSAAAAAAPTPPATTAPTAATPPPASEAADPEPEEDFGAEDKPTPAPADDMAAEFDRFLRALADSADLKAVQATRDAFLPWSKRPDVKAAGWTSKMAEPYARRKAELS